MKRVKKKVIENGNETIKKVCSKCGLDKSLSEFNRDNRLENGYRAQCKSCRKEIRDTKNRIKLEQRKTPSERNIQVIRDLADKLKTNADNFVLVDEIMEELKDAIEDAKIIPSAQEDAPEWVDDFVDYMLCSEDNCIRPAKVGPLFGQKTHCIVHRDFKDYSESDPKCQIFGCGADAYYAIGPYPTHCQTHATEKMHNIIEDLCESCFMYDLLKPNPKNPKEYLCPECFAFKIQKIHKKKENHIKECLAQAGITCESADRKVEGGCSAYRPDFVIDNIYRKIIIEVDEHQHRHYPPECEITRMKQIFQDYGGTPIFFIRYNPDDYKNKNGRKVVASEVQANTLINYVKNTMSTAIPDGEIPMLSVVYMFYDGYSGANTIKEISM
jgi:hypothetical protein